MSVRESSEAASFQPPSYSTLGDNPHTPPLPESPRGLAPSNAEPKKTFSSAEARGGAKLSEQVVKNVGMNFFFLSFELYQSENLQAIIQINAYI